MEFIMSCFCYFRPMLDRVFRQSDLMDRLIERWGIDPLAVARFDRGSALHEARTRCIACRSDNQCRAWLERFQTPDRPPTFCDNADFFNRCLRSAAKQNE